MENRESTQALKKENQLVAQYGGVLRDRTQARLAERKRARRGGCLGPHIPQKVPPLCYRALSHSSIVYNVGQQQTYGASHEQD